MPTQELSGTTALVTGASRGFGRAIAVALSSRGAHVAGVARDQGRLEELRAQLGDTFTPVAAGVSAYAARQGIGIPAFLDRLGPALTPEQVGTAIIDIVTGPGEDQDSWAAAVWVRGHSIGAWSLMTCLSLTARRGRRWAWLLTPGQ